MLSRSCLQTDLIEANIASQHSNTLGSLNAVHGIVRKNLIIMLDLWGYKYKPSFLLGKCHLLCCGSVGSGWSPSSNSTLATSLLLVVWFITGSYGHTLVTYWSSASRSVRQHLTSGSTSVDVVRDCKIWTLYASLRPCMCCMSMMLSVISIQSMVI